MSFDLSPYLNDGMPVVKTKILWRELPGHRLQAYWLPEHHYYEIGITDTDMMHIQEWSLECDCGVRTSFDTWRFRSQEEITMFLLRWRDI